jgi:hypothetical protein
MEKVEIGDKLRLKNTSYDYQVFDITGNAKNTPNSDGRIIYLRVNSKTGWLDKAQTIITITERKLPDFFSDILVK